MVIVRALHHADGRAGRAGIILPGTKGSIPNAGSPHPVSSGATTGILIGRGARLRDREVLAAQVNRLKIVVFGIDVDLDAEQQLVIVADEFAVDRARNGIDIITKATAYELSPAAIERGVGVRAINITCH